MPESKEIFRTYAYFKKLLKEGRIIPAKTEIITAQGQRYFVDIECRLVDPEISQMSFDPAVVLDKAGSWSIKND